MDTFEMWIWRRMQSITWQNILITEEVLKRIKKEGTLIENIKKRDRKTGLNKICGKIVCWESLGMFNSKKKKSHIWKYVISFLFLYLCHLEVSFPPFFTLVFNFTHSSYIHYLELSLLHSLLPAIKIKLIVRPAF